MELLDRLIAEVTSLKGALRTLKLTTPIAKNPTRVFPQVILELADKYGDAPALLSDREHFTYRELAARSNRYARWALAQDLRKGDTVCLMMPGRPEFLAAWIGITRVGGVVALINTHLTGTALAIASTWSAPSTSSWRRNCSTHWKVREHISRARQKFGFTAMPTPTSRASIARSTGVGGGISPPRSFPRSPSRIARSTSTRRERPACRRQPT
jgi:hypothetical protein